MDRDSDRREDAFNALYDAHYDAVRAYAWRRDPSFADDIVAETFIVSWKRLADIPRDAELPWLLTVARNAHLNIQRGERRRRERELADAGTGSWAEVEPHTAAAAAETDTRVLQLLKRLPETDREVLLLVAWEGLDRAAVARVLGCSRANVALRLHRARSRFQALLAEAGHETSADASEPGALVPGTRLLPQGAKHD